MAQERVSMRRIREVLRLHFDHKLSQEQIGISCALPRSTVGDCLRRFYSTSIGWPLLAELEDDSVLEKLLYNLKGNCLEKALPDWATAHKELRKKGVTLQLLWQEYKSSNADGYQYSQFCNHYRAWQKTIDVSLRQHYRPGEYCFIDYAGLTVLIYDQFGNEPFEAQIFVAALGASNLTFCEATRSQKKQDWINSHIAMFEFFGGVPKILVPDNLKSAVSQASYYDPELNPTYAEMARHYDCAVIPARPKKPRDKAKVETAVQIVERHILAPLRNRKFFSLTELNQAIAELLVILNKKPFQKIPGNRNLLFEEIEKSELKALPRHRYELKDFKPLKVQINYHVCLEKHNYSVPFRFIGKEVEARYGQRICDIFYNNKKIATHPRSFKEGGYTTLKEHMPEKHQKYLAWTPERLIRWAAEAGPNTKKVAESIINKQIIPQQGFNSVKGLIALTRRYGAERMEKAAFRALRLYSPTYKTIKNTLASHLEDRPIPSPSSVDLDQKAATQPTKMHQENIRGVQFFTNNKIKGELS